MPSRINTAMVAEYKKKLGESPDFVAVDTKGLSVLQFTELRKLAREKGVQVLVVKTSLAVIALKDPTAHEGGADPTAHQGGADPTAHQGGANGQPKEADKAAQALAGALAGQVALVWGGDGLPTVARLIADYGKKTGKLAVRGGLFEKQVLTPAQVAKFRDIPDRRTLLSQILGTVTAPLTGVLGITQTLLSSPAALADALAKKQETPAAA